jgi:hypothetical protein
MRDTISTIIQAGILAMLTILTIAMVWTFIVDSDEPPRTAHWYQSGECMVWSENTSIMRCQWND